MRRNQLNYLVALAGLALSADSAFAQRSAGETPPVSRIEQRPNLGAGSGYRAPRNNVVRPLTLPQGQLPNPKASANVGFGATFDRDVISDVIVSRIEAGSPAARAGLQRGDTIVSINNQRFTNQSEAANYLRTFAGDRVNVVALRKGAYVSLSGNLAAGVPNSATSRTALRPNPSAVDPVTTPSPNRATPATTTITNAPGFGLRLSDVPNGLVVSQVEQGSLASAAGIRAGDRIMSLGGQRVRNPAEVDRILAGITQDPALDIMVNRDGRAVDLTANLSAYTGYYSTADHNENLSNPNQTRQFGNANVEGLQTTLGATFARTPEGDIAVTRVVPNSYADRAGLQRGDYLYGLNGRTIAGPEDIMQFFAGASPGTNVGFGVWRDGRNIAVDAELDQTFYDNLARTLPQASGQPIQDSITTDGNGNPVTTPQARSAARDPATQQNGVRDGRTSGRALDFNSQPANDTGGFDTNPQNDSIPDTNPNSGGIGTGGIGTGDNDPLVAPQVNPTINPETGMLDNDFNNLTQPPLSPTGDRPTPVRPRPNPNQFQDDGTHQVEERNGTNQGRFGNRMNQGRDTFDSSGNRPTQGAAQGRPATNRPNQPATRNRNLNRGNSQTPGMNQGNSNNSRFNNSQGNNAPGNNARRPLNTPGGRNSEAVRPATNANSFGNGQPATGGDTNNAGGNNATGNNAGGATGGATPGGAAQGGATGNAAGGTAGGSR
jgi:S1-C subfamily serine protease